MTDIESKLASVCVDFDDIKSSTATIESNVDQKLRQTSAELKCIKTDLASFNQVNKDFLHVVKVNPPRSRLSR